VCEKNTVQNTLHYDTYSDFAVFSLEINILTSLCAKYQCVWCPLQVRYSSWPTPQAGPACAWNWILYWVTIL